MRCRAEDEEQVGMKRLLWLGIGLAVGALTVRAVTRKAKAFTPAGLAGSARRSAGGLLDSVRDFVDDVKDGMHEREAQIHAAFVDGEAMHGELGSLDDFSVEEGNHR
jgi:hypothetical protein